MKRILLLLALLPGLTHAAPADKTLNLPIYSTSSNSLVGRAFTVSGNNGKVLGIASGDWALVSPLLLDGSVAMTGALTFSGTTHPGLRLNNLTSTQRDAFTPLTGYTIWNTTTGQAEAYNGSAWAALAGAGSGDVATDTIWAAAGDLVYATGNNASAVLPLGAASKLLQVNAGATAPEWTDTVSLASVTATTGNIGSLVFEGATADAFETTIAVEDPTADRVFTMPNATDTAVGRATTDTLTNKTIGAGALTLAENASIALDPAGSADGKYTGITIAGTAGATLAFGDIVYLAAADSRWELADCDSATTSGNVLIGMVVLAAASDGSATTILLNGTIRADAAFPALTISAPAYISGTAGDIQVAAPSTTGQIVRRVGFALTADELVFNPSADSGTAP